MAAKAATQASQPLEEDRDMWMPEAKSPVVYILASRPNGTLYVGVTSALYDRMREHRNETFGGFTKKYKVKHLVYYEAHKTMDGAISRESQLKKWRRLWKIRLIEEMNPMWSDLFVEHEGIETFGSGGQTGSDFDASRER